MPSHKKPRVGNQLNRSMGSISKPWLRCTLFAQTIPVKRFCPVAEHSTDLYSWRQWLPAIDICWSNWLPVDSPLQMYNLAVSAARACDEATEPNLHASKCPVINQILVWLEQVSDLQEDITKTTSKQTNTQINTATDYMVFHHAAILDTVPRKQ